MTEPLEQFKTVLKSSACSLTKTRRLVFAALQDKEPQTMHEIVAACRGQADRASVYRTISLFEKLGIVQRLQIGWKYKLELSDRFRHHHHHLTCLNCGSVIPFDESLALESGLRRLADAKKFEMQSHQLEIQGLCHNCRSAI